MTEAIEMAIKALEREGQPSFDVNRAIANLEFYREKYGDSADDEVPDFGGSIDAALTLMPENWFWQCGATSAFRAWARVYETHPDHGEPGRNEFGWKREWWQPETTPAIALSITALQAQAALQWRKKRVKL